MSGKNKHRAVSTRGRVSSVAQGDEVGYGKGHNETHALQQKTAALSAPLSCTTA
jgi:hypothetical protein